MFRTSRALQLMLGATCAALLSCGGGGDSGPSAPKLVLTSLNVTLASSSVIVGTPTSATASGLDQNGAPISIGAVQWATGTPSVASVNASGQITTVGVGTTTVTANVGAVQGAATLTVTPPPVATVNVTPASAAIIVGATQQLAVATLDANGAPLTGRSVTWTSSDLTKATVNTTGLVTAVSVGSVTITAASEGRSGVSTITVNPIPVALVTVTPVTATINPGGTQQYTAATFSATGASLTGRTVTWASSDPTKATVSASGLATGLAVGTVTLTATSEGITGTATVTIAPPAPVATVTVAPITATITIGGTTTLTATARDANGNVLTGRTWAWTSSSLATVSGTFLGNVLTATGVSAGVATITATSEGRSGTATVTVVATPPAITSVSPSTLIPGGTMTIAGSGFSATLGGNVVRVGTATATVTSASATQIIATVPCLNTGTVGVTVAANTLTSSSVNAAVAPTVQTLAVGQTAQLLTEASVRCNELPVTGGKYLISVFNASTVPASNATVTVTGTPASVLSTGAPLVAPQLARFTGPTRRAIGSRGPVVVDARPRLNMAAHLTMLERDRELYQRLRHSPSYAASLEAVRQRARLKSVVVPLTVGQTVAMRNRGPGGSCNSTTTATARVVAVNAHSIVLEDNASPTAGQVDADLIALGNTFETQQYAALATFGDINAYDVAGGLDNAGKVVMFFTPTENAAGSGGGILLGHVTTCDFYASTVTGAAGSNHTKIFYARVPTLLTGSTYTQDTRAWWNAVMPGTLIHEAKHILSFAERFAANANTLEESWLEEGTAQMSSDIWSRSVYAGTSWKGNTTYASSVSCDVHRGTTCPSGQSLMQDHFDWLYSYIQNTDSKSFLSPGSSDGTIYGSAWLFARWLVDQYGGATESTLLRALVREGAVSGVSNVVAKTGVPFTMLLADFTMALIADDYPGFTAPVGAKYTVPSWNLRSMWTGYAVDRGMASPLQPMLMSFGNFTVSGSLPGAGVGFIELSGVQTRRQLLDLSALPTGSTIRLSILRVQ